VSDDRTAIAGWHHDPTGRYEYRYFNGRAWTADVSADGTRFVDHDGIRAIGTNQPSLPPGYRLPPAGAPTRTMAVLATVFGAFGVATAWLPFLVVLGLGAAITALVLGPMALKRVKEGRALGRAFAIAGIVFGVISLPLSVVGFVLTGRTVNEFNEYVDPGPNEVEVGRCEVVDDRIVIEGILRNLDDRTRNYEVVIRVVLDDESTTANARLGDVAAGEVRSWDTFEFVPDSSSSPNPEVTCNLFAVYGDFPFGFEPER
jgi:hypothetical protein